MFDQILKQLGLDKEKLKTMEKVGKAALGSIANTEAKVKEISDKMDKLYTLIESMKEA